jgi:AbrB family looped-hinge helix DNA binding protein
MRRRPRGRTIGGGTGCRETPPWFISFYARDLLEREVVLNCKSTTNWMEVRMLESMITRKGQVTIPEAIRDRLRVKEGEKVIFVMRGEEVV